MMQQEKVGATNLEIKVVGTILIALGMIGQTIEFVGWVQVLIDSFNGTEAAITYAGWSILAMQIVLYVYALQWIFNGRLHCKFVFRPLFALDFVASFLATVYYMHGIATNNNVAADLIAAIIMAVFFGSDMLISGGLIYLINNYVPPAPPSSQYILIGKDNQPVVVNGNPAMLPAMDRSQPIAMV